MKSYFLLLLIVATAAAAPVMDEEEVLTPAQGSADILWDEFGVPHIFAENYETLGYAFGYVHARAHMDALLKLYVEGLARSSELWGEQWENQDISFISDRIPQTGRLFYDLMDPFTKMMCETFADGFNAYAAAHPDEVGENVAAALPVSGLDVFAHGVKTNYIFAYAGSGGMGAAFLEDAGGPDERFRARHNNATHTYAAFADHDIYFAGMTAEEREMIGSNAWAVNGQRSSGPAQLVVNPHLAYVWYFRWFEAHLVVESEGLDFYGANLMGIPVLNVGFNEFLGFTHTVNVQRAYTGYELEMTDETHYMYDGEELELTTETVPYRVLREDGGYDEKFVVVEFSVHGAVYSRGGDGRVLVTRLAGVDDAPRPDPLKQWWDMMRASTLSEFNAALSLNQISMFTTMYADRYNNIEHAFLSFVGDRAGMPEPNDYSSWGRAKPGNTSAYLWSHIHPFEDMPLFVNPPSGYLQNANEPPWTTTLPLYFEDPNSYPPYITDRPRMSTRAQISMRLMETAMNSTFEELERLKLSTLVEETFHSLDDLLALCAARSTGAAGGAAEETEAACALLAQWERHYNTDSRGATLFRAWHSDMGGYANGWDESDPLGTPNTLADPDAAFAALETLVRRWNATGRDIDEMYGEVYMFPSPGPYFDPDHPGFPGNGGNNCFRCIYYAVPAPGQPDKGLMAGGGDTIVINVQFSDPPRARACLGYGNTSQRNTAHGRRFMNDQQELMSKNELRDVWITRADIMQHLEFQETVTYTPTSA